MNSSAEVWLLIVLAAVLANLPFVNERLFVIGPRRDPKPLAWRLLELAVLAALVYGAGAAIEMRIGQRATQNWEFFAAGACLFLTLAFPGFVWRYLRRGA